MKFKYTMEHYQIKKILSHVWPFTKKIKSKINGTLEITWIDGKKVLDSENANYSYGALQRVLDFGLSKVSLHHARTILILGLGGGCVIESLRNRFNYQNNITAVELDDAIINIASQEFNIQNSNRTTIIHQDALQYVQNCDKKFDLIIVDIFIDQKVPEAFYEKPFWSKTIALVSTNGNILFNAGILLTDDQKIKKLQSDFESQMQFTQYNGVEGVNTLIVGELKE